MMKNMAVDGLVMQSQGISSHGIDQLRLFQPQQQKG